MSDRDRRYSKRGFGVVCAKPGDGACDAVAEAARGCDGAEEFALRSAEDPVGCRAG